MTESLSIAMYEPVQAHADVTGRLWPTAVEKRRANARARYERDSERIKAKVAAWRLANPQKVKESVKKTAIKHADRIAARESAYREKHRAEARARSAVWRAENPELNKAAIARWHAEHPDARLVKNQNRRAKVLAGGRLSHGIVARLMNLQRGKCAACKADLKKTGHHLDHIVPLALDGLNVDANVQLLCPTCNLKKSKKDPIAWAQENGRLL